MQLNNDEWEREITQMIVVVTSRMAMVAMHLVVHLFILVVLSVVI